MARRGLSTSEKLASGNPAVRREGKKEAAKQTSSQRSRTISKAKTIATKYSGTVDPSKVEGPSQAQIKTAEQTPKTAGEAVRMAREFEGTPAQQQEYLRVISEKATRRQVATQQFVTRAQPTREPARPEATMTRRTAEQVVRFTPGGGQYTRYATPQQRMERPTPATISAAPSWLATQTRLAKERDKFYARKDLPKYKQPPKKEPYVPAEYMPKTFLQKADEYVAYAQNHNQTILATIWPYANWEQKLCKRKKAKSPFGRSFPKYLSKPCSMKNYKTFLLALVDRYDGDGNNDMPGLTNPIIHWEIMNEPEFKMFFNGKEDEFVEIFNFSSKTIKSKQKNSIIIMASAAGMFPENKKFWKSTLPKIKDYFDIANIHHISTPDGKCDKEFWVDEFAALLKSTNIDKPIWVTEAMIGKCKVLSSYINAFANGAEIIIDVGVMLQE